EVEAVKLVEDREVGTIAGLSRAVGVRQVQPQPREVRGVRNREDVTRERYTHHADARRGEGGEHDEESEDDRKAPAGRRHWRVLRRERALLAVRQAKKCRRHSTRRGAVSNTPRTRVEST